MRTHGTLTRWNTDRGFGFNYPRAARDDLFVHLSAFPRGFEAPRIGRVLSFESEPDTDDTAAPVRCASCAREHLHPGIPTRREAVPRAKK